MNSKLQNPLQKMLNDREWILADGATGTNLFNMGLSSGNAPEMWNRTEPKKIKALYQNSVDAGSDLFLTNSFGGNRSRPNLHGAENDAAKFSQLSAEIGRDSRFVEPISDCSGFCRSYRRDNGTNWKTLIPNCSGDFS